MGIGVRRVHFDDFPLSLIGWGVPHLFPFVVRSGIESIYTNSHL